MIFFRNSKLLGESSALLPPQKSSDQPPQESSALPSEETLQKLKNDLEISLRTQSIEFITQIQATCSLLQAQSFPEISAELMSLLEENILKVGDSVTMDQIQE